MHPLDADSGKAQVLLVDRHNGKPLTDDGPFRLIVPGDARPARWVCNVRTIEVVDGVTGSGKTGHQPCCTAARDGLAHP